ncbi:hypothetical protein BD770DRAFT_398757 [Pilaira anomala]|nr:hypothetical protein BD770DRAFT_398757 [Pilaira anomala]
MKYLTLSTVFALFSCIVALPITTTSSTTTTTTTTSTITTTTTNDISNEVFPVQVDRLAQLIATHLQFDHLDAVISRTDKEIATEFQHHIQINVQANEFDKELESHNTNQYTIQQVPTLDMMDLEILKSQISAAIQAHTEGNLPLTWDKLADKLSRQAIESFLRNSLLETCGGQHAEDDIILSSCLSQNSIQLATQLDTYLTNSLEHVFEALDQHALPDLLQHTAQDLKGILKYFNSAFLQNGNRKFTLDVVPWNSDPNDIHNFKSRLLALAVHPPLIVDNEDIHSLAFFVEYANMARV